jgi:hypothetical protein
MRTDTWTAFFNGASRLGDNIVVFAIAASLAVVTWSAAATWRSRSCWLRRSGH